MPKHLIRSLCVVSWLTNASHTGGSTQYRWWYSQRWSHASGLLLSPPELYRAGLAGDYVSHLSRTYFFSFLSLVSLSLMCFYNIFCSVDGWPCVALATTSTWTSTVPSVIHCMFICLLTHTDVFGHVKDYSSLSVCLSIYLLYICMYVYVFLHIYLCICR